MNGTWILKQGLPGGSDGKESPCQGSRPGFDSWVGKIPWRRERQSTPVFLPGEFHGQRSLVGYSPWGLKESDVTKQLTLTSKKKTSCHSGLPLNLGTTEQSQTFPHMICPLLGTWKTTAATLCLSVWLLVSRFQPDHQIQVRDWVFFCDSSQCLTHSR